MERRRERRRAHDDRVGARCTHESAMRAPRGHTKRRQLHCETSSAHVRARAHTRENPITDHTQLAHQLESEQRSKREEGSNTEREPGRESHTVRFAGETTHPYTSQNAHIPTHLSGAREAAIRGLSDLCLWRSGGVVEISCGRQRGGRCCARGLH